MLKSLLQGKWLGHPLHVVLVHLPIGLYVISLILDIVSYFVEDGSPYVRAAFQTMVIGTVAGLLSVFPGIADWLDIREDHPAKQIGIYHMVLNPLLLTVYGVNIAIRVQWPYDDRTRPMWLGLSILGVVLLSISGYLGGLMVYDDGIGVGRHRRRGRTPRQTIEIDSSRAEDGMVPVAGFEQLEDHQTLRAKVNGVVIVVAKVDGEVFAFQEFCTHRFGPLSEGCFEGHQVMCPWHRSCFDMRTGEVTNGPAKDDIRAFRAEVRQGVVYVEVPALAGRPDGAAAAAGTPR